MKRFLLTTLTILFLSCSTENDLSSVETNNSNNICLQHDLGLTIENKNPSFPIVQNFYNDITNWKKIETGNLVKIYYDIDSHTGAGSGFVCYNFEMIENQCPKPLVKGVYAGQCEPTIYYPDYEEYQITDYKIQLYIPNQVFVCEIETIMNAGTIYENIVKDKIWVDLSN